MLVWKVSLVISNLSSGSSQVKGFQIKPTYRVTQPLFAYFAKILKTSFAWIIKFLKKMLNFEQTSLNWPISSSLISDQVRLADDKVLTCSRVNDSDRKRPRYQIFICHCPKSRQYLISPSCHDCDGLSPV